jgi:hypothetical protein
MANNQPIESNLFNVNAPSTNVVGGNNLFNANAPIPTFTEQNDVVNVANATNLVSNSNAPIQSDVVQNNLNNSNNIAEAVFNNNLANIMNGDTTMPPMPTIDNNLVNNAQNVLDLDVENNVAMANNTVSADDWRSIYFEKIDCKGVAVNGGSGDVVVQGEVKSATPDPTIVFWAPNPPTWSQSYSGSGLPYHDSIQAYQKSPNVGAVKAVNRKFEFRVKFPNAYYVGLGSLYVPPVVHFKICEEGSDAKKYHTIELGKGIPYRTLSYPSPPSNRPRDSPLFYHCGKGLPVRTQEQVLRDSGYPEDNRMHDNFWGLKPPL